MQSFVTSYSSGHSHSEKDWLINTIMFYIPLTCQCHYVFFWPNVLSLLLVQLHPDYWLLTLPVFHHVRPGSGWMSAVSVVTLGCSVKILIFLNILNPSNIGPWASTIWILLSKLLEGYVKQNILQDQTSLLLHVHFYNLRNKSLVLIIQLLEMSFMAYYWIGLPLYPFHIVLSDHIHQWADIVCQALKGLYAGMLLETRHWLWHLPPCLAYITWAWFCYLLPTNSYLLWKLLPL